MSKTTVNQGANGQYQTTIPKGLGDGYDLDGKRLDWEVHSSNAILARIVDEEET